MKNESPLLPSGLYALCDDGICPQIPMVKKALALLRGRVAVIQLRYKRTPEAKAIEEIREIVAACRKAQVTCLVNDRVDWALVTQADGVHLGQDDVPLYVACKVLGPNACVGATVRNQEDIEAARRWGAHYVGLGPVFESQTKKVEAPILGLEGLRILVSTSPLPVVAIAGINAFNIQEVAQTGVHGAAVGAALYAGDIEVQVQKLKTAFESGRNRAISSIVG